MTESNLGSLAPGHGTELHRQHEHRQQHRDTSSDISLPHYLYMLHLCYTHCIWFPPSSMLAAFPAVSGRLRKCDEYTHIHTQRHAISSKPSCNSACVPWRQITLQIPSLPTSHALSVTCKISDWLSSHEVLKLSLTSVHYFHLHAALITSWFPLDWWDCVGAWPCGGGGPGLTFSCWTQTAVTQAGSLGSIFSERS